MWGLFLFVLLILRSEVCSNDHPTGHGKPIGSHRPPIKSVEERETFPSPKEMFENYVKASKPVIFRGILEKGMLPAYKRWTDSYLREHFGTENVDVERGKKEDRGGNMLSITMSDFLDRYQKEDIYMVNDASEEMAKEINMPSMFLCGGFQKVVQNVIMWFSSGGTKSVLHNDGLDNVNCLIDGEKYFVMIDKKHKAEVEGDGWTENGAYSKVDVEKVDLYRFPKLRDLPWYEIKMQKGDCLFIPYKWYHHVDSKKGRNFAINIWLHHLTKFNDSDCNITNPDEKSFVSVSAFRKDASVTDFRDFLMAEVEELESMDWQKFKNLMNSAQIKKEEIEKLFRLLDADEDGKITEYEVEMADMEKALLEIPTIRKLLDGESGYREEGEDSEEPEEHRRFREETVSPTDDSNVDEEIKKRLGDFSSSPKQILEKKEEL
ncbi:bifunctional peptidase and arginyl-hydroxylase JMJD5-like [Saccostrea echinata]|uniref:bifunctional peptidase and arginyl-hydroxylase JMJD5-like n=1 Tax=Saccostrea echinata TaxID=191078 RepID=UPI002A836AA7|nr:bifunctional peptidase and arginyl-hydroxylase JMJD5-like [Saccostrea echinata]